MVVRSPAMKLLQQRAALPQDRAQHRHVVRTTDDDDVVVAPPRGQEVIPSAVSVNLRAADGNTVGTEFRVNTTTSNSQLEPAVTGLANGGWVVSWTDQYGAASNTYDVFLQQYDAAGRQVDGETLVNSYVPSVQQQPAITAMADGGFVVAWSSYVYSSDQNGDGQPDGGNNTYEIHLQRYSNTATVSGTRYAKGMTN